MEVGLYICSFHTSTHVQSDSPRQSLPELTYSTGGEEPGVRGCEGGGGEGGQGGRYEHLAVVTLCLVVS